MPKIYTQNARRRTWRPPRAAAALVFGIFTISLLAPTPLIASSWNPTLLVNTEAFQTVSEGDSAAGTDVELRFGDTLNERIYWDRANAEFRFTDDVRADGNITGSGTLIIGGAATLKSTLRVNNVTYTFPYSDGSASGKVLATDSAGTLAWTTAAGPAVAGSVTQTSHGFSVGNVLRFTGTIYATAKANAADNAEVVGIVSKVADANTFTLLTSGKITGLSGLTAGNVYFLSASSSGALTATHPTAPNVSKPLLVADSTTSGYFSNMRGIIGAGTTLTGSVLRVMSGANSYILSNLGVGTTTPETKLEVVGAISGSSLQVTGSITMSGTTFNTLPLGTVEGRLTLTSGTPVTTIDVTAATTIYFTPYKGDRIYLYDGTRWKLYSFSELSLALGTLTASLPYDVFIYDNAGTLTLEALAWTNGTTRATALVTQNGVLSKTGVLTRRYLGTFYTTSTTTTEDSVAKRDLWNYYNRTTRKLKKIESTASWTYATAAWRSMNNSTANRVETITGWAEVSVNLNARIFSIHSSAGQFGSIGIDVDGTTTNDADMTEVAMVALSAVTSYQNSFAYLLYYPAAGYHFYQLTEYTSAATATFYGTSGVQRLNGMVGFTEG